MHYASFEYQLILDGNVTIDPPTIDPPTIDPPKIDPRKLTPGCNYTGVNCRETQG